MLGRQNIFHDQLDNWTIELLNNLSHVTIISAFTGETKNDVKNKKSFIVTWTANWIKILTFMMRVIFIWSDDTREFAKNLLNFSIDWFKYRTNLRMFGNFFNARYF